MNNRTNVQKSLVYPGAGWDSSFIECFRNRYSNFILIDALPGNKYYPSQCNGYQFSKDRETFFNTLIDKFADGANYEHNEEKQMFIFYHDKFTTVGESVLDDLSKFGQGLISHSFPLYHNTILLCEHFILYSSTIHLTDSFYL